MVRENIEDILSYDEGTSQEYKAQLLAENLLFEASIAQETFNQMVDSEEGNPSYHWARSNFRERIQKAQELYEEALEFDYPDPEEYFDSMPGNAEEMAYRNKWRAANTPDNQGVIEELEEEHRRNMIRVAKEESISTRNPYTMLNQVLTDYENLVESVDDSVVPGSISVVEREDDGEFVEDIDEENRIPGDPPGVPWSDV